MTDVKSFLTSKTLWGAFVAIAASGLSLAKIDLGDVGGLANDLTALAGAVFAIYGRAVAFKKIG